MPKLRLIAVRVQPVLVLDDGEQLQEIVVETPNGSANLTKEHPIVEVSAAEWPTYAQQRFAREIEAWQARVDAEHAEKAKPAPNRAQRRARTRKK